MSWRRFDIKKSYIRLASVLLLGVLLFGLPSAVLATSVDRMALCNLEAHPGETVEVEITLQGTGAEERSGYWYTYYKQVDGDDARMDITSWITIEPEEYTIAQGLSVAFTVRIKIPGDAAPGLWGATSEEAWQSGHSVERRTYLIFKDTPTGGNVYSGLLIPVSVKVIEKPTGTQSPVLNYIKDNIIVVVLGVVVIILLAVLLARTMARRRG